MQKNHLLRLNTDYRPAFYAVIFYMSCGMAQAQPPVTVKSYGQHVGATIIYNYQVTNNTNNKTISAIAVGRRDDFVSALTPDTSEAQLSVFPSGSYWDDNDHRLGGINNAPSGWIGKIQLPEAEYFFWFEWSSDQPNAAVLPGQTINFSVTVPREDKAYLTGYFTSWFAQGPAPLKYTAPIELVDTTPPTLSVSLIPATLWPPNGKPVPVTATVTVKDDYDPNPEIKLEAITANEPLLSGDIMDAQYGTDDRRVALAAQRAGQSTEGRIYTLTYTATDASGNKATATAHITVPHDQRK